MNSMLGIRRLLATAAAAPPPDDARVGADTEISEFDGSIDAWTTQLIRIGALVMLVFEAASLVLGISIVGAMTSGVLLPHVAAITATLAFYLFTWTNWYQTRWRESIFAVASTVVATTTAFSLATNQSGTFVVSIILILLGAAALVPWGARWQAVFTVICGCGVVVEATVVSAGSPYAGYQWLELATAAALAQFIAPIAQHYRRQMQERLNTLRKSEAKLWKIFETSPDSVMITRLSDGRFISVSDEFLKGGFSREEVLRSSDRELGLWADQEQYLAYYTQLKSHGSARNIEALIRRNDGTTRPCIVSGGVIEFSHGPCAVSLLRDISRIRNTESELMVAREEALAASRAKSEFLSAMSHEIRTPMNAILGMADLLSETSLSTEQRKYLSIMMNNGAALLDLIDDILDLARVESGKLTLEAENFDLCDLVERVAETLSIRAHKKQLEIAARIAPGSPATLIGDPLRLRQVLINLLGNAIKFTDAGEIVLTVERDPSESDPGRLHFMVSDTGIGLAKDQREQVFVSYTQANASTARKYGGTGLGLAIVKQLVELMDGRIWVESELGKGSTFHFTARFGVPTQIQVPDAADLRGMRVLVVDDTAVTRLALIEALSAHGANVSDAAAIEQALAEIERASASSSPFDVILLDCRMPPTDSNEIVRRAVAVARAGTVVPMLTSDDLNIRLPLLRTMGLPHYLIKPVRHAELFAVINALIRPDAGMMASIGSALSAPPAAEAKVAAASFGEPAASASHEVAPEASERPLRILVADDSADNRLLIEAFLKRAACLLDEAENGQVALQKFINGKYDVVIMDIQMPVMDGYTATRRIREWERDHETKPTPIIALTASVLDEAVTKSLEAGCDTHVNKPVRRPTLLGAIREVTGRKLSETVQSQPSATSHVELSFIDEPSKPVATGHTGAYHGQPPKVVKGSNSVNSVQTNDAKQAVNITVSLAADRGADAQERREPLLSGAVTLQDGAFGARLSR